MISLRFDLPDGGEAEYAQRWIQAVGEAEGVQRVRLYRADSAVSNITTSERKIYGGGPGKQAYLVFVELSAPPDADVMSRADSTVGVTRDNDELGKYWLEIAHRPLRRAAA
jgi:hypothetical protein